MKELGRVISQHKTLLVFGQSYCGWKMGMLFRLKRSGGWCNESHNPIASWSKVQMQIRKEATFRAVPGLYEMNWCSQSLPHKGNYSRQAKKWGNSLREEMKKFLSFWNISRRDGILKFSWNLGVGMCFVSFVFKRDCFVTGLFLFHYF